MTALKSLALSPEEAAAKAFWLLHTKSPADVAYILGEMFSVVADFGPGEEDLAHQEMQRRLTGMGYVTTLDALDKLHDLLKAGHAGYWGGAYGVLDSKGRLHRLNIDDEHVRFHLEGWDEAASVESDGGAFVDQRLTIDNEVLSLDLRFTTASDALSFDHDDIPVDMVDFPTFSGTLVIKTGDGAGTFELHGKRDAFTAASVRDTTRPGEPLATWVGEYLLRYTDDDGWTWFDDALTIAAGADGAPSVKLGDDAATAVAYAVNAVSFTVRGTEFLCQLSCTTQGSRRMFAQSNTNGRVRTLTGYATTTLGAAAPEPRRRALRAGAPSADKPDFCATTFDFRIDATELMTPKSSATPPAKYVVKDSSQGPETKVRTEWTIEGATWKWSSGSIVDYQPLGPDYEPRAGYENTAIGYLFDEVYRLPDLVETDYYEVRLTIDNYDKISGKVEEGLTIALAKDAPQQTHLIEFIRSTIATCTANTGGWAVTNPDTEGRIVDLSKATVLVQGTSGETQVTGFHHYVMAVTPGITAKRTRYDKDGEVVGTENEAVEIPILVPFKIMMDSRDPIELSGTEWPPLVQTRRYSARVTAQRGTPPYRWELLDNDELPTELQWKETGNHSYGVSGSIPKPCAHPGSVFAPVIRVSSAPSVVMKPLAQTLFVTVAQPEQEGKEATDWVLFAAQLITNVPLFIVLCKWLNMKFTKKEKVEKKNAEKAEKALKPLTDKLDDTNIKLDELKKKKDVDAHDLHLQDAKDRRIKDLEKVTGELQAQLKDIREQLAKGGLDPATRSKLEKFENKGKNVAEEAKERTTDHQKEKQADEHRRKAQGGKEPK